MDKEIKEKVKSAKEGKKEQARQVAGKSTSDKVDLVDKKMELKSLKVDCQIQNDVVIVNRNKN